MVKEVDERLLDWISSQISKGFSFEQIKKSLLDKGWKEHLVDEAMKKVAYRNKSSNKNKKFIIIFSILFFLISAFIVVYIFTNLSVNSFSNIKSLPAPKGYILKSDFFKNDPTAISLLNKGYYNLSLPLNTPQISTPAFMVNTSSFEFKLLNAFKEMGYIPLTYSASGGIHNSGVFFNVALLNNFQEENNLSISDIVDGKTLSVLDSKLYDTETRDKIDSSKYPPLSLFIPSPENEVPNEHLAALYYRFYQALPVGIPDNENYDMARTIDEFRTSLAVGMGGNLGTMMNSAGTRTLNVSELFDVYNSKGNFKFCASAYYSAFEYGNCTNVPLINEWYVGGSDFGYFLLFAHEFGHGVGNSMITINGTTDRMDFQFGKISFGGNFSCLWYNCPLGKNSIYWLRQDNYEEFVTPYARNGYLNLPSGIIQETSTGMLSPPEDFAESFAYYLFDGNLFRERAKGNLYLQQKYDFLKKYVFNGTEYNTGNIIYYNSWLADNPNATPEQKLSAADYRLTTASGDVWNGTFPTVNNTGV
ncbi:MAG: hypothetical protein M1165_02125 [Candidatus Pacearchaeota archaeon]|nr:hypothetical protein [Candidatus Pacearchaeota archaeon]